MSINNKFLTLSLLLFLGSSVGLAEQASNIYVALTTKQARALEAAVLATFHEEKALGANHEAH